MSGSSYRNIFKASSLLGGTQVVVLLIRMVRAKALAVIVGASGTGLIGLYTSTIDLVEVVAGLGIKSSGVRQIAAVGTVDNKQELARAVRVLRWWVRLTGILGALVMVVFCRPLAQATFSDVSYAGGVALMGVVVALNEIAAGQWALLQGLRRIKDLAKSKILGTLFGACTSILLLWSLGERGVLPYLIISAVFSVLLSWWFARRVSVPAIHMTIREYWCHGKEFVTLGAAFVVSGLVMTGTPYLARAIVVRDFGTVGVGLFGAATTLSTLFVGFVLQAMGTDFYPRLVAVSGDHQRLNRLVNEQTEMVLLMSMPGILLTFVLAPWLLRLLYTGEFVDATLLLRWLILGMALKIVSWPMGFIQLAKSRKDFFVSTEIGYAVIYVVTLYLVVERFGLASAGVATVFAYMLLIVIYRYLGKKMSNFAWSVPVLVTLLLMLAACALVVLSTLYLEGLAQWVTSLAVALIVCVTSLGRLRVLLKSEKRI